MTTTISSHPVPSLPHQEAAPERIVLYDVSWQAYETLLKVIGERNIHLTYDNGALEIMTLSLEHESWKSIISGLIRVLSLELNLPIRSVGSVTSKRADLKKGLEPDECYYVRHEAQMRAVKELDLDQHPPPDLAVEIDISYHAVSRERIYAALGVPEVWRFDGQRLHFLHLASNEQYELKETSLAFPFLRAMDMQRFLILDPSRDETSLMREFRDWVRVNLLPGEPGPSDVQ